MPLSAKLSPRTALVLFLAMVAFAFAQAVWWIIFMARVVGEKVDLARELGGAPELVATIQRQEITRQIMVGTEGVFFLVMILAGAWLIYRALVRAEELKFHQQNFLSAVTHELKTPLASMKLYLDSLQSTKIAPEKKETIIPKIAEDIERLERLVEDILEAGRFDRSGYHLDKATFDFSVLLEARLARLASLPSRVPVQIAPVIPPRIMMVGDATAMGRALDTVLENSLKYHDDTGIHLGVKLEASGGKMHLRISDKGIGFDPKEANSLFERFYRVGDEMTRTRPGTGLGLYLCREIIRAHGGSVTAHSDGPGKGATFTITLTQAGDDEDGSDSRG